MIYITDEDYLKAEKHNIKPKTLYARVYYYGYDIETATTKSTESDPEYTYWLNMAKSNGVSHSLFSQRIKKMSYEEAATKPKCTRGRKRRVVNA